MPPFPDSKIAFANPAEKIQTEKQIGCNGWVLIGVILIVAGALFTLLAK